MNKHLWNVLVFPGGTEVGLEINKSLRYLKEVNLFSVASGVKNHAEYYYRNHVVIPDIYQKEQCLLALKDLIAKENIDVIIPANPLVMDFLAEYRKQIPCKVLINDDGIMNIIRSKRATYHYFEKILAVPTIYKDADAIVNFPVFAKPDRMYGAQGATIINNKAELNAYIGRNDYIVTEYLPGAEYTIDCFSSLKNGLMFCAGRTRERIRMGTSMHSELAPLELQTFFNEYANLIQQKLNLRGAWFFQLKQDVNGQFKLLEIEARIAGTMALNRVRGLNFSLLNLYEWHDLPVNVLLNEHTYVDIDRSLANRYKLQLNYDKVYVDLDDTIICNEKIHLDMVKFLYQCINKNIKIILISKSTVADKLQFLRQYRIVHLFDELIWLKEEDVKAEHINPKNAIFIDDSFSQRKDVYQKLGIPTFDSAMLECLLDERM